MARVLFDPAYSVVVLAVILLIAALVTPADPLSMLLVGLPVFVVYLIVARWFRSNRDADADTTDPSPRKERIV